MRYSNTDKTKKNGIVYTPAEVAAYVADEILKYRAIPFANEISILDPAVGTGELLIAMLYAIGKQAKRITAIGYETDEAIGNATQKKLEALFPDVEIEMPRNLRRVCRKR